jgi:mono/diheme cytochrome c family protein
VRPAVTALALLLPFLPGCRRDPGLPPEPTVEEDFALRRGRQIYRRSCIACHGDKGRGDGLSWPDRLEGRPADLTRIDRARLEAWRDGHGGRCPDWRGVYGKKRLVDLIGYLERAGGGEE